MVDITALDDFRNPYFYIHLHVINDLRVLISFTLFEVQVLAEVNIAPSQILANGWSLIMMCEIMCQRPEVWPTIWMFFFLFMLSKLELKVVGWPCVPYLKGHYSNLILIIMKIEKTSSWELEVKTILFWSQPGLMVPLTSL